MLLYNIYRSPQQFCANSYYFNAGLYPYSVSYR